MSYVVVDHVILLAYTDKVVMISFYIRKISGRISDTPGVCACVCGGGVCVCGGGGRNMWYTMTVGNVTQRRSDKYSRQCAINSNTQ